VSGLVIGICNPYCIKADPAKSPMDFSGGWAKFFEIHGDGLDQLR